MITLIPKKVNFKISTTDISDKIDALKKLKSINKKRLFLNMTFFMDITTLYLSSVDLI
jgi:hypothetical protein